MDEIVHVFDTFLTPEQKKLLDGLTSPAKIQEYLDSIPYVSEDANRNPLRVMTDRQCHCLDGAFFAAAALRRIGYPAEIIDMFPEPGTDDDHVLALYKKHGYWGAVAKSNYVGLRFREPVYRSLRELVMTYFDVFFNTAGQKTLREYTRPLNLKVFDPFNWMWSDDELGMIEERLKEIKRFPVVPPELVKELSLIDKRSFEAGTLGSNVEGFFKVGGVK